MPYAGAIVRGCTVRAFLVSTPEHAAPVLHPQGGFHCKGIHLRQFPDLWKHRHCHSALLLLYYSAPQDSTVLSTAPYVKKSGNCSGGTSPPLRYNGMANTHPSHLIRLQWHPNHPKQTPKTTNHIRCSESCPLLWLTGHRRPVKTRQVEEKAKAVGITIESELVY